MPNQIKGITLLSIEEAEKVPQNIRKFSTWWWLRSPGDSSDHAADVVYDGYVDNTGNNVNFSIVAVRPALICSNLESLNLKIGDFVSVFDKVWQYIGNDMILLFDEPLTRMAFRKDRSAPSANVYEKSDVKKYIDSWLKEQIQKYRKNFSIKIYKNNKLLDTTESNDIEEITDTIDEVIEDGCSVVFTNNINGKEITLTPENFT